MPPIEVCTDAPSACAPALNAAALAVGSDPAVPAAAVSAVFSWVKALTIACETSLPLATFGVPAAFSLVTAWSVSDATCVRKPSSAFLPSAGPWAFDRFSAWLRDWTVFSNGPIA